MLHGRSQSEGTTALSLPPAFVARKAVGPLRAALTAAQAGVPAGTLFHAPIDGLLEAALILTPDRPVDDETVLRLATLAAMQTLIAIVPPKTPVEATAPGMLTVDGGQVATITLARGPAQDGWMVLGVTVRVDLRLAAPGLVPHLTDLAELGVEASGASVLEAFCRHLLAMIDLWQAEDAPGIAAAWRATHALLPA